MTQNSPATNPANLQIHRLFTGIAIVGTIAMVLVFLRRNGFWVDELYTLHSIRLGWREMVMERLNRGHFPGYFALVRLWYDLWPERLFEVALRSMSVVFYLLAVASFWPLARRVLSAPAALVALALFACNDIALRQASEARMYTVVLLIAVWITRAWYQLRQPGSGRHWAIILAVLTVIGFAVSATIGVLIITMLIVSLIYRKTDRRTLWTLVVSLLLGLVVFIPGAILHIETAKRLGISSSKPLVFLAHPVALMPGVQLWDDYYKSDWRPLTMLIIGIPITCYAIWAIWKNRRSLSTELRRMALIVSLPLVVITLCYPLVELYKLDIMGPPRYFITLLPMASMLGAWALMRLPRPVLVHGVLTVFLLVSAYVILTVRVERFRDVVLDYLHPLYQPGDGLVVTANEIADGVELYMGNAKVDEAVSRWEMDKAVLRKTLEPLSSRRTVWVVWYRGNESPLVEVAQNLWGDFESNKPDKELGSLRVFKFQPGLKKP